MTHPNQITNTKRIREFVFGGKARFTLKSLVTGTRYTYRVTRAKDGGNMYFVRILTAPDDYTYIGFIKVNQISVVRGKKGAASLNKARYGLQYLLQYAALHHDMDPQLEFWHEGRCARCARPLTDPQSIEQGFGPECIKHAA